MKLLTKKTDYAIRAIMHLAFNTDKFVSSKKISESELIPLQFLRGILQTLTKENIIESQEGISGGVKLKKDPHKLKLTKVIEIFQGKVKLSECILRKKVCPNRAKCVLRKLIVNIENKVVKELKVVTIGSLIDDIKNS